MRYGNPKTRQAVSAVILSGGLNSRHSGRNKALIRVGGIRIIDRLISVLRPMFDELVLVTNDKADYTGLDVSIVSDYFPNRCSLTGLHAGLRSIQTNKAFVVACDAPFVSSSLVRALIGMDHPSFDVTVPLTSAGYEPLFAMYSKNCLRVIERHLYQKKFKISDLYACLNVATVREDYLREHDPELMTFFNVNTPDMIAQADEISVTSA